MGLGNSRCICLRQRPNSGDEKKLCNSGFSGSKILSFRSFFKANSSTMTRAERAIKAALLIQRWYRRYCARLEVRRRYTWTIFQSIEYAGEQDHMKLHTFFNALLTHIGHSTATAELVEALSPKSSPTRGNGPTFSSSLVDDLRLDDIPVEYSYKGFHIRFPITTQSVHGLIDSFKKKKQLHAKYVCLLLREASRELKTRPTVMPASTAISSQITVVGDLHGKLDDLLTILYKNGLPSTDNPYVFNGDFVDRGKKSVEVIVLLSAMVLAFPSGVYLNRGNHEDMIMNARYGFCKEVNRKYKLHGPVILRIIEEFYRWLPFATVIDQKVLVVHGGISDKTDIHRISSFERGKDNEGTAVCNRSWQQQNVQRVVSSLSFYLSVLKIPSENYQNEDDCYYSGAYDSEYDDASSDIHMHPLDTDDEWKLLIDLLWSDPQSTCGCSPNLFRGGGTYFGPDITRNILELHGYQLLIRSHECKVDGYEYMHDNQCLTIFSASNYYETGSNRGAYVKLQGPDLEPHFVQYMADAKQKYMTIRQRVGRMEGSAIRELRNKIIAAKSSIISSFKEHDLDNTGYITISDWVNVMEEKSQLKLPWRVLRERLVVTHPVTGRVEYMSTFREEVLNRKTPLEGGPTVVEALYRHKSSLETVFRLIDKDNSGFISMAEFEEACDVISKHMETKLPKDEIQDLARSMDINKDGKIDFNEFLECFRIVDTQSAQDDHDTGIRDDDDDDEDYDEYEEM